MRRRLLSILFFSMLAVFSLSAQEEDSDWFWNKNISKIEFSGLKNVKKSELVGVVSSFIGEPFNEEVYSEIVDRLYALDLFDDIYKEPKKKKTSKPQPAKPAAQARPKIPQQKKPVQKQVQS